MENSHGLLRWALLCTTLALISACSSTKTVNRAPVEDRGSSGAVATPVDSAASVPAVVAPTVAPVVPAKPPPPGIENAGKPGYYTVKRGDTLIRIGLENGQSWRDLVRWNALENPNRIEEGQVLRIIPPGLVPPPDGVAVARPITLPSAPVAAPLPGVVASPAATAASTPTPASTVPKAAASAPVAGATAATAAAPAATASNPVANSDEDLGWIWPTNGAVLAGFDEAKNKGLDLAGKAGDPVYAAGDGRVVYAGSGLRGYGNLIILKHNNTYLTAYAHNQTLLIKEDQSVRKGQKIAEMGNSDADRVKLHFEIRRQGKPVDPMRYLPAR